MEMWNVKCPGPDSPPIHRVLETFSPNSPNWTLALFRIPFACVRVSRCPFFVKCQIDLNGRIDIIRCFPSNKCPARAFRKCCIFYCLPLPRVQALVEPESTRSVFIRSDTRSVRAMFRKAICRFGRNFSFRFRTINRCRSTNWDAIPSFLSLPLSSLNKQKCKTDAA